MPLGNTRPFIIIASLIALLPLALPADVIVLMDGKRVAGDEITDEGDAYTVRTKYGVLNVPKSTVAEVIRVAPLLEQARSLRMGGVDSLKRAEAPGADETTRKLEAESAEESLKQALDFFTKARAAATGVEAEGIDRVIAGVQKELARCRALAGPQTLEPVAPPAGPDAMPPPKAADPPKPKPKPVVTLIPRTPPPAPVPPDADRKRAEAEIRDLFKAEYARRSAEDRLALAARLIKESAGTRNDPAARYVLLAEAADLAARAGDPATALEAIDRIAAGFTGVDAPALKAESLATASRTVKTPEAAAALAEGYLAAADGAAGTDDYDAAVSMATKAESAARRARDAALVDRARGDRRQLDTARGEFRKIKSSVETLKEKPDDPAACAAVGRFRCMVCGDFERGLPLLAKGSDSSLRALAEMDLGEPADVAGRIALGDSWWSAGDAFGAAAKDACRERAVHWYGAAAPEATGLTRTRIEKRIAEYGRTAVGRAGSLRRGLILHLPFSGPGPRIVDASGRGNHGRARGGRWVGNARGSGNGAYEFDGIDDLIDCGNGPSLNSPLKTRRYSMAAWLNPAKGNEGWRGIAYKTPRNTEDGYYLTLKNRRPNLGINNGGYRNVPCDRPVPADGRWHHVAATYDGKTGLVHYYLDGEFVDRTKHTAKLPSSSRASLVVAEGATGLKEFYAGLMDDLMIWDRALSREEVQLLYRTTGGR